MFTLKKILKITVIFYNRYLIKPNFHFFKIHKTLNLNLYLHTQLINKSKILSIGWPLIFEKFLPDFQNFFKFQK